MMPPPTPVPSVASTILVYPLPPPHHISPSAATLASFPALTGIPSSPPSVSLIFITSQPRFTALCTTPLPSTGPGTPMPTPATSSLAIFFSAALSSIAFAMSGRILLPFSSFLVGISHFSSTVPSGSNNPSFTEVPPKSTPKQYSAIFPSPYHLYRFYIGCLFTPRHPHAALTASSARAGTAPAQRCSPSFSDGS